ncbi:hypothetical protein [Moorena producens]|nr:hypothetical protein [Moorena producens]
MGFGQQVNLTDALPTLHLFYICSYWWAVLRNGLWSANESNGCTAHPT